MMHKRKALTRQEVRDLDAAIPGFSFVDENEVESIGGWVGCISVPWHTDDEAREWSALVLVSGKCVVERAPHASSAEQYDMEPGDLLILNIHEHHRAYSLTADLAIFLACDFDTKPTRKQAMAEIRALPEYAAATQRQKTLGATGAPEGSARDARM